VCGTGACLTDASASLFGTSACNPGGTTCPAVQVMRQVPQFWYNAILYASQATSCAYAFAGTIPR
jgi:hypothetical protein